MRRASILAILMLGVMAVSKTNAVAAPPAVAPIPPRGIEIAAADRAELQAGADGLGRDIEMTRTKLAGKPDLLRFLPDVEIFYNAVRYPLKYDEFYTPKDVATARKMLKDGSDRLSALNAGKAPWTAQSGLVVLGYVSGIDGSVQPYGLVVPPTFAAGDTHKHRLDFFLHGRDEKLTELHFIDQHQRSAGEFTPADTFVLHPYGRYCNANRFAGEVDLFEALADAKRRYPIDPDRVIVRGFSMGGASCWQFATHHAGEFAAAAPGAGFTETANYTNAFAAGKTPPPPYEQALWHWYDSVDYAVNLAQCPTVAYSGEIDKQRKAADNMDAAMSKVDLKLTQVIGPNTAHKYAAVSKPLINKFLDDCAEHGRNTMPLEIRFTTWTLRYDTMDWLTVDTLDKHWKRATVEAKRDDKSGLVVKTENVTGLTFRLPVQNAVTIDGQEIPVSSLYHRPFDGDPKLPVIIQFHRTADGKWADGRVPDTELRKRHGLQGPIDDAFMDRFVMVRPTGKPLNAATGTWVQEEMAHAADQWRAMFRGEAPIVDDTHATLGQLTGENLVLWGDPSSNRLIGRIAPLLPIRWDLDGTIHANGKVYAAGENVPILIYPNPLSRDHYVVINSGMTFREAHYSSNALQTPKLPDWAIVDITTPPDARAPGKIVDAGFFDEDWK